VSLAHVVAIACSKRDSSSKPDTRLCSPRAVDRGLQHSAPFAVSGTSHAFPFFIPLRVALFEISKRAYAMQLGA